MYVIHYKVKENRVLYVRAFRVAHSTEIAEAIIVATAHLNDVPFWTLNRKHYPMKDIAYFV